MANDPKKMLENQVEMEKMEIPVPEQTLEAAVKRAYMIASKLRASKEKELTPKQIANLQKVSKQLRANILSTNISADEGNFSLEVPENVQECASEFEEFGTECKMAAEEIEEKKIEASEKLVKIAKRLISSREKLDPQKVFAYAKKLVADATKLDLMRNLTNIEQKSQKDQTLKILVDWDDVSRLSPGIGKMTKLQDLKVQDLKNILVSIRGGKQSE